MVVVEKHRRLLANVTVMDGMTNAMKRRSVLPAPFVRKACTERIELADGLGLALWQQFLNGHKETSLLDLDLSQRRLDRGATAAQQSSDPPIPRITRNQTSLIIRP